MRIIKATYDGRTFHPDEPLALPADTRVTLVWYVEEPEPALDSVNAADIDVLRANETFA
jgi:hypothetical protein